MRASETREGWAAPIRAVALRGSPEGGLAPQGDGIERVVDYRPRRWSVAFHQQV